MVPRWSLAVVWGLGLVSPGLAGEPGVEIQPDPQGQLEYEDDFTTVCRGPRWIWRKAMPVW
jgi:hypothetical protein